MKKSYIFIAMAMVAAMTISCKNNKKSEDAAAVEEVVEAAKVILADDVLATLDELAETVIDESGKVVVTDIISSNLTEEEKLIIPDYFLDPELTKNMITKSQKINALAVLAVERPLRVVYGMPLEAADEAYARLAADLNAPITLEDVNKLSASEKYAKTYQSKKESGDLQYFWQFNFAAISELAYLISRNPDLFYRNLTEEQYQSFHNRYVACLKAVGELAKYDPEIALAYDIYYEYNDFSNIEDGMKAYETLEDAKRLLAESKDIFEAKRAALLGL